jgi:DNA-binding NarL/FixJ family response regulator
MEVKVLIVEDNKIFNMILAKKVQQMSAFFKDTDDIEFKIFSASNAEEAARIIETEKPKISILDYLFDDYSGDRRTGIELLVMLKEQDENSKVIMISRESDHEVVTEAIELGAEYFISKENQLTAIGQLDMAIRGVVNTIK